MYKYKELFFGMSLSRRSILNEFIRLYQLYHGTSIEVFKGDEYTVIVYYKIDPLDERYIEDVNVFIDIDRLIVCIGEETVIYEEELSDAGQIINMYSGFLLRGIWR